MRGCRHDLLSAAVICEDGAPIWRHVGTARLTVRTFSDAWLDGYLARNWPDIADSVGSYKLEAEGVRLFSRIEGDYFTILGLPLLDLLGFLTLRGDLAHMTHDKIPLAGVIGAPIAHSKSPKLHQHWLASWSCRVLHPHACRGRRS